jgi:hypothetical protein
MWRHWIRLWILFHSCEVASDNGRGNPATGLWKYNETKRARDSSIHSSPHTVGKPMRMLYFSTTEFDPAKKLMSRFGCDGMQFNSEIKVNLWSSSWNLGLIAFYFHSGNGGSAEQAPVLHKQTGDALFRMFGYFKRDVKQPSSNSRRRHLSISLWRLTVDSSTLC